MTLQSKQDMIIEFITQKIKSGEWLEGDRLPSHKTFKDEHGFKYGPLRSAYLVLKAQGILEGRQGDGVFVAKSSISMTLEEFDRKQKKAK